MSISPEGGEERQLAPLMEDGDEMSEWGHPAADGQDRPPLSSQRRASAPPATGFGVDEYGNWEFSGGNGEQDLYAQPRSNSLPASFDNHPHPSLSIPDELSNSTSTDELDYPYLLASLHALSAPSYQPAPLSSLSTAADTRLHRFRVASGSSDAAFAAVHPQVGLSGDSLLTPQPVPGFQEYSWMPQVDEGAPQYIQYADEELEALLSGASSSSSSLQQSSSATPITVDDSHQSTSIAVDISNANEDIYAFPPSSHPLALSRSHSFNSTPTSFDPRTSHKRILDDLDARDSPFSTLPNDDQGQLPAAEVNVGARPISQRRRASFPLLPSGGAEHLRLESPRTRRDSLIDVVTMSGVKKAAAVEEEEEEEEAVDEGERASKRRKCDGEGLVFVDGAWSTSRGEDAMAIEAC
jgi:hypothetical protein